MWTPSVDGGPVGATMRGEPASRPSARVTISRTGPSIVTRARIRALPEVIAPDHSQSTAGRGPLHRGEQAAGARRIDRQAGGGEPGGAGEHRPPPGARWCVARSPRHRVGPSARDSSHHFESWWRARVGWSV